MPGYMFGSIVKQIQRFPPQLKQTGLYLYNLNMGYLQDHLCFHDPGISLDIDYSNKT